jgi:hypothetical protein
VAGWYREALAELAAERGLGLPCPDEGGERRGWFVYVVQLPRGVERDPAILALRELAEHMLALAGWIDAGVEAARREDEAALERIRAEVLELARAFPPPA